LAHSESIEWKPQKNLFLSGPFLQPTNEHRQKVDSLNQH
jgi:hypothetical protein